LWLGARRHGHAAVNALAYPIMGVLLLTVLLAYSRGSLLALAIGCAVWFAVVPLRLRGATVLAVGAAGALLVALWAFGQDTLTKDKVALGQRAMSGHELGLAALVMVIVLLLAGLAIGFWAASRAPSERTRRRAGATILGALALVPVLAIVALALSSKGLGGSISSGWRALTDPHDQTRVLNDPSRLTSVGSVRARYWDESYKIWRAHKPTGVGAGGYATARLRFRADRLAVQHAHGYVVQTAADLGLLGLFASGMLLVAWALAAGRTLGWRLPRPAALGRLPARAPPGARAPHDGFGPEHVAMATLIAVVLIFGVHSFIDWTWFVPGTAVIALLAAGWVAGRGPLSERPGDPRDLPRSVRAGARTPFRGATACFALAVGLLAAWTAWQPLRSAHSGTAALAAAVKGPAHLDEARSLALAARDRNPLSIDPLVDLAFVQTAAKDTAGARQSFEQAVRLQPSNPAAWEYLARFVLDQQNDPQLALRLLGPALYLDPKSPTGAKDYLDAIRAVTTQAQQRAQQKQKQAAAKARRKARHRRG
jgi:cytochrome c-type biogenesis protein CcmH/NrfG